MFTISAEKIKKDLGIEFLSTEETVVDTVNRLLELEKQVSA
jgi:hypothetical protein